MTGTDTRLIAGLGNPGKTYANTRHNIGFMAVERLGTLHDIALTRKMSKSLIGRGSIKNVAAIITQPLDYMNRSGPPIARLARYFDIRNENIIVLHDDLDIEVGKIKIKAGGGHGGHKGVRSIIDALGTNGFTRIRIGIGRPQGARNDGSGKPDITDFVLGKPSKQEMEIYLEVLGTVCKAVETIVESGVAAAMNTFNR